MDPNFATSSPFTPCTAPSAATMSSMPRYWYAGDVMPLTNAARWRSFAPPREVRHALLEGIDGPEHAHVTNSAPSR